MLFRLVNLGIKPAACRSTLGPFSLGSPLRCARKRLLCREVPRLTAISCGPSCFRRTDFAHSSSIFLREVKAHFKGAESNEQNVQVFTEITDHYLPLISKAKPERKPDLLKEALDTIAYAVNLQHSQDLVLTLYYNCCLPHLLGTPPSIDELDEKEKELHFKNLKLIDEVYLRNPKRPDLLPAIATSTLLAAFTSDSDTHCERIVALAVDLLRRKGDPEVVERFRDNF